MNFLSAFTTDFRVFFGDLGRDIRIQLRQPAARLSAAFRQMQIITDQQIGLRMTAGFQMFAGDSIILLSFFPPLIRRQQSNFIAIIESGTGLNLQLQTEMFRREIVIGLQLPYPQPAALAVIAPAFTVPGEDTTFVGTEFGTSHRMLLRQAQQFPATVTIPQACSLIVAPAQNPGFVLIELRSLHAIVMPDFQKLDTI
jgi:hypothetical protein